MMQRRTANYRGYAIEGASGAQGWLVEVHPRGADFPILSKGSFRVAHPSWTSAVAEACERVDAALSEESEPHLPQALEDVFDAAWSVVSTSKRVLKSRPHVQRQLRRALARCIVGLAANGTGDPNELRRQAIERIVLDEGIGSSGHSSLMS